MALCQVFRAPEGGGVNRMRVELEVKGWEMLQSRVKHTKGWQFSKRIVQQVSILGRHIHDRISVHVRTCGFSFTSFNDQFSVLINWESSVPEERSSSEC